MRVLIAPDAFKDSLSAPDACAAIARGLAKAHAGTETIAFPMADGGEGTRDILAAHLGLTRIEIDTEDALRRPIRATYGWSAQNRHAFIELASAAGLEALTPHERDPMRASTYGVGRLIADAIARGAEELTLAIGGSATNDCGIGLAGALGWRFLDANGAEVSPIGANLAHIARIEIPARRAVRARVMCDVAAPLLGPTGAARTFARQKGADDAAIVALEAGAENLARCVTRDLRRAGLENTPGAGAAGGVGFGALAFLDAQLRPGADLLMDIADFDAAVARSDLVITGEGRLDAQTAQGKVVAAVARRAMGKPVIALCGAVQASPAEIAALSLHQAVAISDPSAPLAEQLAQTAANLERAAAALTLPS